MNLSFFITRIVTIAGMSFQGSDSLAPIGPLSRWLHFELGLPTWIIVLILAPVLAFVLAYLLRTAVISFVFIFEKRPNYRKYWRLASLYSGFVLALFILYLIWEARVEWLAEDLAQVYGISMSETLSYLTGFLRAIIATVILILAFYLLQRGFRFLIKRLETMPDKTTEWRFQKYLLLSSDRMRRIIILLLRIVRLILILVLLNFYIPVILSFFPATEEFANKIMPYVTNPSLKVINAIINYFPNFITLLIIVVCIKYLLGFLKHLFVALEKEEIKIKGFDPDWADQTSRLVRVVVILMGIVIAYPFLPGAGSDIFKGFSIFIGAIITLGSTSAINNIVSGIVLTYAGAFRVGDRVKIGNTLGDVIEKKLFVTRLKTFKNEYVTFPNGQVLGGSIVNLSKASLEEGTLVEVTAGISYDVDWRKVHQLMKNAALETPGIVNNPEPFVLQTDLGDFAVSYRLMGKTNEAKKIITIESELRRNLLDQFNKEGIEIMSPSVTSIRESDSQMIPTEYNPKLFSFLSRNKDRTRNKH